MHICVHIQYVSKYGKMDVHVELSKPIVSFLVKTVEVLSVPKDEESGHPVPVSDNHHSNFFFINIFGGCWPSLPQGHTAGSSLWSIFLLGGLVVWLFGVFFFNISDNTCKIWNIKDVLKCLSIRTIH